MSLRTARNFRASDRDAGIASVVIANLAWLPVTRRWLARARVCWASSIFLVTVYLTVALRSTLASRSGAAGTAGGVLLWVFELFAAVLSCAYLWEICEALGTRHWRRRAVPAGAGHRRTRDLPMISLHVPAHNEPPAMVIDTLRSLVRLDYPRYEIIVIDDNTDDEALWRPVQQWCARHGVKFVHLEDWPGYKSGALNYALRHLTDPRAELIGVVDSDYQIEPGFLRACARSSPIPGSASSRRRRITAAGSRPPTTAACSTPTSISSPFPSRRAMSTTAPSSPAPWGSSGG